MCRVIHNISLKPEYTTNTTNILYIVLNIPLMEVVNGFHISIL